MELIEPGEGRVHVMACPHPFKSDRTDHAMEVGLTLAEMVEAVQPDPLLRRYGHAFIGDNYVPQENWHRVRPKPGTRVTIRMVPQGGDGKDPLNTVMTIAVIAAAAALPFAFPAGSILAAGTLGGALLSAFTGVAGEMAVNAEAAP